MITHLRPHITMKSVLSRPVTSVPTALFHEHDSLRKTAKSNLSHIFEGKLLDAATTKKLQNPSASTVYICDPMAELQSLRGLTTFNRLAECYMNRLAAEQLLLENTRSLAIVPFPLGISSWPFQTTRRHLSRFFATFLVTICQHHKS